jgi:hypothetical protein
MVMPNFTPMTRFFAVLFCVLFITGCKGKEEKPSVPAEQFFPVPTYIRGELAKLEKSLASFYKIASVDGRSDTIPIPNTEVKNYAQEFANLPDISSSELKDDYQVTQAYDDMLGSYVFMFTTKKDHPVRREDVMLDPELNAAGTNAIQSIFVELWQNNGDTTVRKNMFWEAGKNFQITTIKEAGGEQKTEKLQVVWNGFDTQSR